MAKVCRGFFSPLLETCNLEYYSYQLDPYRGCQFRCAYCSAVDLDENPDIIMTRDIKSQLAEEISNLEPQVIYLGMKADPYQPCEEKQLQTRKVLELLAARGFSVSILTKSDLVLRDLDLLAAMDEPAVGASVAYLGREIHDLLEPLLPPVDRRLEALGKLREQGIETYLLICPFIPCITDLEGIVEKAASAVDKIWVYPLSFKDEKKKKRMERIVARHFPRAADIYARAMSRPNDPYWREVRERVDAIGRKTGMEIVNCI